MKHYHKIFFSLAAAATILGGCGGGSASAKDTQGPLFETAGEVTVAENGGNAIPIKATDESGLVYSIAGGADADKFQIDGTTGLLTFLTAPDFEHPSDSDGDGRYEVVIAAVDGNGNTTRQPMTITLSDDPTDNGPAFDTAQSGTIAIEENRPLNFTVRAQPQSGEVTYRIAGGADGGKFEIDPDSGKLSFAHFTPDADFPSDADKNNSYEITIEATDDQNRSSLKSFTLRVSDDPDDLVPSRTVWKTGADDGVVSGLPFGADRDFRVENPDGERVIVAGSRMWEDSPHARDAEVTFYEASNYCEGLNYGGYDDWRAPSRHELAEMLNYGNRGDMFDDILKYTKATNYWTSQQKLASGGVGSDLGWSISFVDGGVHDKNKGDAYNVRCVRGTEIDDHHDFSVEGDTVIDNQTGITWQNAEFRVGRTWEEAKQHCKELVFADHDDWRLPNINELRTIMPYDNNEILFEDLSPIGDGNLDSGHSWSSTEADDNHAYYNLNDWDEATNRDSLIVMYEEYPKTDNDDLMLNRCIRGGHL